MSEFNDLLSKNSLAAASSFIHSIKNNPESNTEVSEATIEELELKKEIREFIKEEHRDLIGNRGNRVQREKLAEIVTREVKKRITGHHSIHLKNNREKILTSLINDLSGFGPLDPLLEEKGVSEIQVNGFGPGKIRVEKEGKREWVKNLYFEDKAHILRVIEQILIPTNRPFDPLNPFVDAWLPDGSRVNAVFENVAVDGPYISIRRFLKAYTIDELLNMKPVAPITHQAAEFLRCAIESDLGILIAGGTGAGKTTWLNALSGYIPKSQSIVTAEDSLEIQLQHPDVRRHVTTPPNAEGVGEVKMDRVVKNMLRQFPDFIIVGETRGDEAWDITEAGNTGHVVMTTVHSNSAADGVARYSNLIYSSKPLPHRAIQEKIQRAFKLVVYAYRDKRTGIRAIKEIVQLGGLRDGEITIVPLFTRRDNLSPLEYTGNPFLFAEEFEASGIAVPDYLKNLMVS